MIIIVLLCLVIHCAFYLMIFSRLAFYKETSVTNTNNQASIIICFKNEEDIIDDHLPSIIKQAFGELVLVDDNSSDKTLEKLNQYKSEKVKVLSIQDLTAGKKNALAKGVQEANNNTILLTDADCVPASVHWSAHMNTKETPFVLGYGPMNRTNNLVGMFSRFETYMTALQYLSYALAGIPYMGVGRNMRIDKSTVSQNKTKIKGSKLASGDDDLMINSLATKENTSISIHPDSFMYSNPKTTLKSFLNQKTRHVSTSVYYKPIHKVLLTLFSGSLILFYTGLILSLVIGTITFKLALILLLVKWVLQQVINFPIMKKLKEGDLFWKFPILDVLFFVYLLIMPFYYFINKNNSSWS